MGSKFGWLWKLARISTRSTSSMDGTLHAIAAHMANDSRSREGRSLLIADAAELLGVSRRTVYYRIREGRLRTIRTLGGSQRVLVSSIEVLLREAVGLVVRSAGSAVAGDGQRMAIPPGDGV
jgi:excisionase family DNA binding protein